MSRLTVGSLEGLSENSNVISVPTGHTLNAVDGVQLGGENITPYAGRKNLLYNGAMQIAQRATSASYGSSGSVFYRTADRWKTYANGTGSFTQSIEDDGPAGFAKSLKILCTASATLTTGEGKYFAQELEGQDLQHLAYGTASAKTMTFSFWVKSNVVTDYHTVVFHFKDGTNTYLLSKTYSVSAADTWEHKTITVPGATIGSGILNNTSAYGMSIRFWLSAGTNFTGSGVTNSNWVQWTDNEDIAPFYDQDISTSGDYWQVTGLQLEIGNKATPFEHRSYGEELALCQRYCQVLTSDDTYTPIGIGHFNTSTQVICPHRLAPQMRVAPSFSINNSSLVEIEPYDENATASILTNGNSEDYAVLEVTSPTAKSVGDGATLILDASGGVVVFDAEL